MSYSTDFFPYFQSNVSAAFRELLSVKHLYQSTRVNTEFIDGVAHALHEEAKSNACIPRYSSSVVAYQSGQSLAAVFLLRVFVEQYWRSIDAVVEAIKEKVRPTGDEIGQAYKSTLPPDFSGRFPSLCEVYGDLSAAIHSADDSPEIYPKACEMVIEHFDARRLFRLVDA